MKHVFTTLTIVTVLSLNLQAQVDCAFFPKDTINCYSMKDDVRSGSKTRIIDSIQTVPSIVKETADSVVNSLDSSLAANVQLLEARRHLTRTDYKYLSNAYFFLYVYRPVPMVKIMFGVAVDSVGGLVRTYGIPGSLWKNPDNNFLPFCETASVFNKKYPSTQMTKYRELKVIFDKGTKSYFWKMRKIKSSIVNKLGDRKGIDCKLTIDGYTQNAIRESKKKVFIKHSMKK